MTSGPIITARLDQTKGQICAWTVALFLALILFHQPVAAKSTNALWRPLPWHLVDYFHRLPPTGPFQSLEITTQLEGDADRGANLYISPLWGQINETGFYFGFLSDLYDPRQRKSVGKGLIFSRWGKSTKGDTSVTGPGWAYIGEKETSGEGDFASIRLPYPWGPGLYSFNLHQRKPSGAASDHAWFELTVLEHRTKQKTQFGALKFYGERFTLSSKVISFIEIYADRKKGKYIFPSELPNINILFGLPLVNKRYSAVSSRPVYGKDIPRLTLSTTENAVMKFHLGQIPVPQTPSKAVQ